MKITMERVESTSSTPSPPTGAVNQLANPNNPQVVLSSGLQQSGVAASVHNPNNGQTSPLETTRQTSKSAQTPPKKALFYQPSTWTTVARKKIYSILIPRNVLPGNNDDEKKVHAYGMLKNLESMTSPLVFATVNDQKVLRTSFQSEDTAKKACTIPVSEKDSTTFQEAEGFKKVYNDNHFQIRIQDVPLDTDKQLFEDSLSKIDKIVNIRYQQPRDLYYVVHVTFEQPGTRDKLQDLWALSLNKHSYRFVPADITNEQYLDRQRFCAKLTNLSHGITAFDLEEVLKDVKAKTCFIPKKRDGVSYQREHFAFVSFSTQEEMNKAYKKGFMLKKNGLVFTPTSQRTCFTCGSSHYLQFQCYERHQKENSAQKTSQFSSIYSCFHAKPSYPKGYSPVYRGNTGEWREEDETYEEYMRKKPIQNWDWDSIPLPT